MPPKKQNKTDLQNFFDDTLTDMLMQSPAVRNLHPVLRKVLERNIASGDEKICKNALKTLLKEAYEYLKAADALQKKYGIDPEAYIKKLESWVGQNVREDKEKNEQKIVEKKIKKSLS